MPLDLLQYFRGYQENPNSEDNKLMDRDLINSFAMNVQEYIENQYTNSYNGLSDKHRLYLCYYYEGVRKYYMKELRIGRYYLNIRCPYTDRSLIEILLRSRLSSVNHGEGIIRRALQRLRSHFTYTYIIDKHMPELLDIATDRGYKPKYDLSFFNSLLVLPQYVLHKMKRKTDQYMYDKWAVPFAKRYSGILRDSNELKPLLNSSVWNQRTLPREKMHRLVSIAFYLDAL
jgi:hypothetical protein